MRARNRLVLAFLLVFGIALAAAAPGTSAAAAPLAHPATSGSLASGIPASQTPPAGDLSLVYGSGLSPGHLIEGDSTTQAAMRDKLNRSTYSTVPFWASAFDSGGITYPFFMVGNSPSQPGTTVVRTELIPIDLTSPTIAAR